MAEGGGDSGAASGRSPAAPGRAPPLPASARRVAIAPATPAAAPVDFDALSAALGRTPSSSPKLEADSHGRASASYASPRPLHVPASRTSAEADPSMPAVIVSVDDTVPSAPPRNMTTPLGPPVAVPHTVPFGVGHAMSPHAPHVTPSHPPPPSSPISSAMHHAAPSRPTSSPGFPSHPPPPSSQPSHPFTPPPFPVQAVPRHVAHPTVRMPEAPRRPRSPTVVVREQGPSTAQKLGAFMAMLVLFTACGIAVIVWLRPSWLGLAPPPGATSAATNGPAMANATTSTPAPNGSPSVRRPASTPASPAPAAKPR